MPVSTTVAGPVRVDLAMSCTGLVLVEVKYWVIFEAAKPSALPNTMAKKIRVPGLLTSLVASVAATPRSLPT